MPAALRGILRLAEFPLEGGPVDIASQIEKVARLEREYRDSIAPSAQSPGHGTPPSEYFNWADELERIRPKIQGLEHWEQIEHQMIAPHVHQVLQALPGLLTDKAKEHWEEWRERYVPELLALLQGFRLQATERSRNRTRMLAGVINPLLPEARREEPLSRKALWIVGSTPGVTCVLNGMRTVQYVQDSLNVLNWEPLQSVSQVYERMKMVRLP
jgi:hypothetical protein